MAVFVLMTTVIAKDRPEGKPFQEIWEAINNLQDQIDNIQPSPPSILDCSDRPTATNTDTVEVYCSEDYTITGGGCWVSSGDIRRSYPIGNGWHCEADYAEFEVRAYAICCKIE